MMKKFDIKGIWWLPERKDNKLNGILHYIEDKEYTLELFGKFEGSQHKYKHSVINGCSVNGVGYTLCDCLYTNIVTHMPDFPETTINVSIIFENIIVEKFDDIRLNAASFSFSFLDNWVHTNGFASGIGKHKLLDVKNLIINYCLPDKIENKIDNDFYLNINFIVNTPTYTLTQKKMRIKQKTEIEIIPQHDNALSYFIEKIMYFRHFLMLALNANTKKLYIKIKPVSCDNIKTNNDKPAFIYIKDKAEDFKKKEISPLDMVFSYPSIKDRLNFMLNTWYKNHTDCYSAYTLYFETLHHKGLNLENFLLNLTQTLESYHRKKYNSEYMDKEEFKNTIYKKLVENIPSDLESDFKESLKSKIRYGYEYFLRRRLKEIFQQNNNFLKKFISDHETLINEIVETRNYYTHYDEKSKFVKTYSDLYELCEKIKVIFISLLLFDLGFKFEEVQQFIEYQEMLGRLINVSKYDFRSKIIKN